MRMTMILAAGVTLAFAAAANAQQAPATPSPAQPPAAAPEAPSAGAPAIQSVNIVDMAELPAETQTKVNEVVAERGEDRPSEAAHFDRSHAPDQDRARSQGAYAGPCHCRQHGFRRSADADHQEGQLTICDVGCFRGPSAKPGPTCR